MMNKNKLKPEFSSRLFCNPLQLVLCHLRVGFVIDSFDLAAIFKSAHYSPEIDHCACIAMILRWRFERCFSQ